MEKQISKINISKDILNGTSKQYIRCPRCEKTFNVNINNKHGQQKIINAKCPYCNYYISYGDIYNFDTGNKLNKRLEKYNQDTYDKKEWNNNYDII